MNGANARIILRYFVGMALVGSPVIGERLATDPDVVLIVSALIGVATEYVYVIAKRKGWAT